MGRTVIGVDLGGTNLRTALLSAEGEVLDRYKDPPMHPKGGGRLSTVWSATSAGSARMHQGEACTVAAVGVGAPGVIRADTGVVVKSPNFPDWNNLPLRKLLEEGSRCRW